jgi:hypothetical protein
MGCMCVAIQNTTIYQPATTSAMKHIKFQSLGSLNVIINKCDYLYITNYTLNNFQ